MGSRFPRNQGRTSMMGKGQGAAATPFYTKTELHNTATAPFGGGSAAPVVVPDLTQAKPSLRSLSETVLPYRTGSYVATFCEKLEGEGILDPSTLSNINKDALQTRLSSVGGFNLQEIADAVSLQTAVIKDARKGGHSDRNRDRGGGSPRHSHGGGKGGKSGKRGGRSRSRSPEGRPGRRDGSRPLRTGRGGRGGGSRGPPRGSRGESPEKPPLWLAVEDGDINKVSSLLQDGHEVDEKYKSWTPLMKAAEEDHYSIINMLLQGGANLHATNHKGRSALSFAAAPSMKRPTAVKALKLLLEQGADPGQEDERGCTAKDRAERESREDALSILEDFEPRRR